MHEATAMLIRSSYGAYARTLGAGVSYVDVTMRIDKALKLSSGPVE